MQKIFPFLWFEKEVKKVAKFYASVFKGSKIKQITTLRDTPSGTVDVVSMEIYGYEFGLLGGGPLFKFTPAISFMVTCDSKKEVGLLWKQLSKNGKVLMELGEYPFSEQYGWIQDRYGLSWQLMVVHDNPSSQRITPSLMFVGDQCGKAEQAMNFYASVFRHTGVSNIQRYGNNAVPDNEGTVQYAHFTLEHQQFAAMDSALQHNFTFNEAISFVVRCDTQEEIDHYWERLSADPTAEQCGWLKDQFGISWQINPVVLDTMLQDKDAKKVARVTEAFLKMKKFDIETLKKAYAGNEKTIAKKSPMLMEKQQFKSIDGYIKTFPKDVQDILEKMRRTIRKAAPDAVETISYQMPAFKLNGNLVFFAAFKNHIGFYPVPSGTKAFKKELSSYKGGKGSVQFPLHKPIPYDLVRKIVIFRVKENLKKKKK
jgi:predicted 3-demethylubiquinone-9 3-methyltransferase (glyoxalase superfamily)/uncharacterized protein YdhG (YjbR/CyaY superfamily)